MLNDLKAVLLFLTRTVNAPGACESLPSQAQAPRGNNLVMISLLIKTVLPKRGNALFCSSSFSGGSAGLRTKFEKLKYSRRKRSGFRGESTKAGCVGAMVVRGLGEFQYQVIQRDAQKRPELVGTLGTSNPVWSLFVLQRDTEV